MININKKEKMEMNRIDEMGMALNRIKRLASLNFSLFKKFFENLYMMPKVKCYVFDRNEKYEDHNSPHFIKMFQIYGNERLNTNINRSRTDSTIYMDHENGAIDGIAYIVNFPGFIDCLFNNWKIMYECDIDNYKNVYFGLADLELFEKDELCKVGFETDMYIEKNKYKSIIYKADTVVISFLDLYNNIEEIYNLMYGEDE